MADKVENELVHELGFRVDGHQVVYYRYTPTDDGNGEELAWMPFAAKPVTTGETALWDQLVVARRANAHLDEEIGRLASWILNNVKGEPSDSGSAVDTAIAIMTRLLHGKAISPPEGRRPGPTHGEAAEPRRG
jgi:hypothetical protein